MTELRVNEGTRQGTFRVPKNGEDLHGILFDGTNIILGDSNNDRVVKLSASDGTVLSQRRVGDTPWGIASDGADIWVTNIVSNNVARLRTGGGTVRRRKWSQEVLFSTAPSIWVANYSDATVSKITPG